MNKKLKISILLFCISLLTTYSQVLWKISGNKLKNPSYIFGTHRFVPISFLDSIPKLYESYNTCNLVFSDMIINKIDISKFMNKNAIMKNKSIKDLVSSKEFQRIDSTLCVDLKLSMNNLITLYPALIEKLYENEIYRSYKKIDDDEVLSDSYFQIAAAEKNIEVIGLKSTEQELELIIKNINIYDQAMCLVKRTMYKDSIINNLNKAEMLYKSGKIDLLFNNYKGNLQFNDFLAKQNNDFFNSFEIYLHKRKCFIVLNAIHLSGNNGIINLLKEKGYNVRPIY